MGGRFLPCLGRCRSSPGCRRSPGVTCAPPGPGWSCWRGMGGRPASLANPGRLELGGVDGLVLPRKASPAGPVVEPGVARVADALENVRAARGERLEWAIDAALADETVVGSRGADFTEQLPAPHVAAVAVTDGGARGGGRVQRALSTGQGAGGVPAGAVGVGGAERAGAVPRCVLVCPWLARPALRLRVPVVSRAAEAVVDAVLRGAVGGGVPDAGQAVPCVCGDRDGGVGVDGAGGAGIVAHCLLVAARGARETGSVLVAVTLVALAGLDGGLAAGDELLAELVLVGVFVALDAGLVPVLVLPRGALEALLEPVVPEVAVQAPAVAYAGGCQGGVRVQWAVDAVAGMGCPDLGPILAVVAGQALVVLLEGLVVPLIAEHAALGVRDEVAPWVAGAVGHRVGARRLRVHVEGAGAASGGVVERLHGGEGVLGALEAGEVAELALVRPRRAGLALGAARVARDALALGGGDGLVAEGDGEGRAGDAGGGPDPVLVGVDRALLASLDGGLPRLGGERAPGAAKAGLDPDPALLGVVGAFGAGEAREVVVERIGVVLAGLAGPAVLDGGVEEVADGALAVGPGDAALLLRDGWVGALDAGKLVALEGVVVAHAAVLADQAELVVVGSRGAAALLHGRCPGVCGGQGPRAADAGVLDVGPVLVVAFGAGLAGGGGGGEVVSGAALALAQQGGRFRRRGVDVGACRAVADASACLVGRRGAGQAGTVGVVVGVAFLALAGAGLGVEDLVVAAVDALVILVVGAVAAGVAGQLVELDLEDRPVHRRNLVVSRAPEDGDGVVKDGWRPDGDPAPAPATAREGHRAARTPVRDQPPGLDEHWGDQKDSPSRPSAPRPWGSDVLGVQTGDVDARDVDLPELGSQQDPASSLAPEVGLGGVDVAVTAGTARRPLVRFPGPEIAGAVDGAARRRTEAALASEAPAGASVVAEAAVEAAPPGLRGGTDVLDVPCDVDPVLGVDGEGEELAGPIHHAPWEGAELVGDDVAALGLYDQLLVGCDVECVRRPDAEVDALAAALACVAAVGVGRAGLAGLRAGGADASDPLVAFLADAVEDGRGAVTEGGFVDPAGGAGQPGFVVADVAPAVVDGVGLDVVVAVGWAGIGARDAHAFLLALGAAAVGDVDGPCGRSLVVRAGLAGPVEHVVVLQAVAFVRIHVGVLVPPALLAVEQAIAVVCPLHAGAVELGAVTGDQVACTGGWEGLEELRVEVVALALELEPVVAADALGGAVLVGHELVRAGGAGAVPVEVLVGPRKAGGAGDGRTAFVSLLAVALGYVGGVRLVGHRVAGAVAAGGVAAIVEVVAVGEAGDAVVSHGLWVVSHAVTRRADALADGGASLVGDHVVRAREAGVVPAIRLVVVLRALETDVAVLAVETRLAPAVVDLDAGGRCQGVQGAFDQGVAGERLVVAFRRHVAVGYGVLPDVSRGAYAVEDGPGLGRVGQGGHRAGGAGKVPGHLLVAVPGAGVAVLAIPLVSRPAEALELALGGRLQGDAVGVAGGAGGGPVVLLVGVQGAGGAGTQAAAGVEPWLTDTLARVDRVGVQRGGVGGAGDALLGDGVDVGVEAVVADIAGRGPEEPVAADAELEGGGRCRLRVAVVGAGDAGFRPRDVLVVVLRAGQALLLDPHDLELVPLRAAALRLLRGAHDGAVVGLAGHTEAVAHVGLEGVFGAGLAPVGVEGGVARDALAVLEDGVVLSIPDVDAVVGALGAAQEVAVEAVVADAARQAVVEAVALGRVVRAGAEVESHEPAVQVVEAPEEVRGAGLAAEVEVVVEEVHVADAARLQDGALGAGLAVAAVRACRHPDPVVVLALWAHLADDGARVLYVVHGVEVGLVVPQLALAVLWGGGPEVGVDGVLRALGAEVNVVGVLVGVRGAEDAVAPASPVGSEPAVAVGWRLVAVLDGGGAKGAGDTALVQVAGLVVPRVAGLASSLLDARLDPLEALLAGAVGVPAAVEGGSHVVGTGLAGRVPVDGAVDADEVARGAGGALDAGPECEAVPGLWVTLDEGLVIDQPEGRREFVQAAALQEDVLRVLVAQLPVLVVAPAPQELVDVGVAEMVVAGEDVKDLLHVLLDAGVVARHLRELGVDQRVSHVRLQEPDHQILVVGSQGQLLVLVAPYAGEALVVEQYAGCVDRQGELESVSPRLELDPGDPGSTGAIGTVAPAFRHPAGVDDTGPRSRCVEPDGGPDVDGGCLGGLENVGVARGGEAELLVPVPAPAVDVAAGEQDAGVVQAAGDRLGCRGKRQAGVRRGDVVREQVVREPVVDPQLPVLVVSPAPHPQVVEDGAAVVFAGAHGSRDDPRPEVHDRGQVQEVLYEVCVVPGVAPALQVPAVEGGTGPVPCGHDVGEPLLRLYHP
eukprot:765857-Hanusia_phi.AAC.2